MLLSEISKHNWPYNCKVFGSNLWMFPHLLHSAIAAMYMAINKLPTLFGKGILFSGISYILPPKATIIVIAMSASSSRNMDMKPSVPVSGIGSLTKSVLALRLDLGTFLLSKISTGCIGSSPK
ncbi:UDP-N-acetylglucosamine 1-carboxyvinyltransferase [Gossypium arboreum]|uniref:UDP-N-acetylglucosamine 1-carboxyvinyltransferase n=1 Tax=Gossypium arboreum TaxID=29729 RepID=A0A0B0N527_GOSAR|nr:UDP-N-acetylglucosamine 1-carboxyvinyltransferase [Gossypium arboreum]